MIIVLIAGSTACGDHGEAVTGSDPTTTTSRVEPTTLDGIIDDIVYSQDVLTRTRGLNAGRTIVQMQVTSRDLKGADSHLSRPDLGVPKPTIDAMRNAITTMDSALEDAMECLKSHIAASACEPKVSVLRDRADAVGEELASLIPYGTRSAADVEHRVWPQNQP